MGFIIKSPHGVAQLLNDSMSQLKNVRFHNSVVFFLTNNLTYRLFPVHSQLASSVSEADLGRAKNAAKFEYAENWTKRTSISENLGKQLLSTGKIYNTADYFAGIDKVSAEDIQKVAPISLQQPCCFLS